jgi:hypothetical protein
MAVTINASTTTGLVQTADTSGVLQLQTNSGTTALTIDTSQNVGIGTTTPTQKLEVIGNINISADSSYKIGSGTDRFITYRTANSDILYSFDSGDFYRQDIVNSNHSWFTGNAERMRIDSSGILLLAGTSAIAGYQFTMYHTDTGGMAYKYNGTSQQNSCSFQNGNGQVGRIYTSGSNTTYSTSSDYRLKENVVPMTGALDKVALLNPVTYTWKVDGTNGQGFIAHELQAVVPDCVGGTKDAVDAEGNPVYQDVDTSYLVATLTAAIKEQQTLIVSQSELITNLTARITALEAK